MWSPASVKQEVSTGMLIFQIIPNRHFWWNCCINIYVDCALFEAPGTGLYFHIKVRP